MTARRVTVVELTCDGASCYAVYSAPLRELSHANLQRASAKADGWTTRRLVGGLMDFCPTCTPEYGTTPPGGGSPKT